MDKRWGLSVSSWHGESGYYLIWSDNEVSVTIAISDAPGLGEYPGYFESLGMDRQAGFLVVWNRELGHNNWEFAW